MSTLEESKMRVRSVAAIVASILVVGGATVGFAWNAAGTLAAIKSEIREQSAALAEVRDNSYTLTRASEQALRTAMENPGMRVPDPRDPGRIIVVAGPH